jgi:hypothetical protein
MEFENMKDLLARNLRYMKVFVKAFTNSSILQPAVAKLSKCKQVMTKSEFLQVLLAKIGSDEVLQTSPKCFDQKTIQCNARHKRI